MKYTLMNWLTLTRSWTKTRRVWFAWIQRWNIRSEKLTTLPFTLLGWRTLSIDSGQCQFSVCSVQCYSLSNLYKRMEGELNLFKINATASMNSFDRTVDLSIDLLDRMVSFGVWVQTNTYNGQSLGSIQWGHCWSCCKTGRNVCAKLPRLQSNWLPDRWLLRNATVQRQLRRIHWSACRRCSVIIMLCCK